MESIKNILWSQGISGDLPIMLVNIKNYEDINIIYDVLKAHEYFRSKGILIDLVIINKEGIRYDHPLWNSIYEIISTSHLRNMQNLSGGVFLLRGEILSDDIVYALRKAAKIIVDDSNYQNGDSDIKGSNKKLNFNEKVLYNNELEKSDLEFYNGYGGFNEKDNEYVINISNNNHTPMPWSNVIANKEFGSLLTETGGGFTWMNNSREYRITPWSNDFVSDKRGEIIYVRDNSTGELFNPYLLPCGAPGSYEVRYGLGYAKYISAVAGFRQELTVFVPREENIKISILKVKNTSDSRRNVNICYYIEPVLYFSNNNKERYINTKYENGKIVFKNEYEFTDKEIFMKIPNSRNEVFFCLDKEIFFGELSEKKPEIFDYDNIGNVDKYNFPIGALQITEEFEAGEEKSFTFLLGENKGDIIEKYSTLDNCFEELEEVKNYFKNEIMRIRVKTPDKAMNMLLNGFVLYQTLVCRIWGRSAFYQSGGASGFRDQLQDSLAFLSVKPGITKNQILLHASHQFEEGDVLHWWHREGKKGTRTKFSDDLLWLPFAVSEYISVTDDKGILNEEVGFVCAEELYEYEDERYLEFTVSERKKSIFKHCILAIDRAYRLGERGLVLMGSGDWNDGMNTVGNKGKGESVWLSMFVYKILTSFSNICRIMKDDARANDYAEKASILAGNINRNAWGGEWYYRAFFDDGKVLGSAQNDECRIDSISQSWSVISGVGEADKVKSAMNAVEHHLIDKENGIVKLLTPAFVRGELNPGYIKSYPEGIRENGGQYTHAAVWTGIAYAMLKDRERANIVFDLINPINHSRTDIEANKYKVEPYVMTADVYSNPYHIGRGGWSWYTGAASWMYRFAIEHILGLKKKGEKVILSPLLKKEWDGVQIEYSYKRSVYKIKIENNIEQENKKLIVDGVLCGGNSFDLIDDGGIHFVEYM